MNKKTALLALIACYSAAFGARGDCFNSYNVQVNNNSGGLMEVKKTKGLVGISRKTELQDGQSARALVQRRGSELRVVAGPEDDKSTRNVTLHSRMIGAHQPEITFTEHGIETRGFYTKDNNYRVLITNQSGGIAKIVDTCQVTGASQKLAQGSSMNITVKPDSYIVAEIGPEKKKVTYQINFADQTGKEPTITFGKRGFTTNGVIPKDLLIKTERISTVKPLMQGTPVAAAHAASMRPWQKKLSMPQVTSNRSKRNKIHSKKSPVVSKTTKKHPRFARRTK